MNKYKTHIRLCMTVGMVIHFCCVTPKLQDNAGCLVPTRKQRQTPWGRGSFTEIFNELLCVETFFALSLPFHAMCHCVIDEQ